MKCIISIYLLITVLPGLSQKVDPKDSLTSTSIIRNKYSITCPNSWKIDTSRMMGSDMFLFAPLTGEDDNFRENINVFVQSLVGQGYDIERMGKESEKQISNFVTNVQIIESRLETGKSTPYYILRYKGQQGKQFLFTEQRYFLKDEIGYAITFTAQEGKEDSYNEISKLILDSFSLL